MKIYIVRHGETDANKSGCLQGWIDEPLNEMGILLAQETGKAMKGIRFDAAFSSPLIRARHTAELILQQSENDCDISFDDRIKEISMGDYEGKSFQSGTSDIDPEFVRTYIKNPLIAPAFPNGESVREVMVRTQKFIKELSHKDFSSVLVSTHGCALRCMLNFLYENPQDFWHGHVPYNCCVNVVEAEDGKLTLTGDDLILYDKSMCVDRYSVMSE